MTAWRLKAHLREPDFLRTQSLVCAHRITHAVLKRDYAADVVFRLTRFAMPYSLACGLLVGLWPKADTRMLLRVAFLCLNGGIWGLLPIKRRHNLWPEAPLRAARHATRIVWSGSLASLMGVLAVAAGHAACSLFIPESAMMNAFLAWSAVFLGLGVFGIKMIRAVRGVQFQYAGAIIYALLFLSLFAF